MSHTCYYRAFPSSSQRALYIYPLLSRPSPTWGELRPGSGDITQTTRDFTGQLRDGTGLLFYGARFYDPKLGRFVSPDSLVPQTQGTALTVDFHESALAGRAKQRAAPAEPQQLNRYSYVRNNPLRYTDPSGHACDDKANGCGGGDNWCAGCDDSPDTPGYLQGILLVAGIALSPVEAEALAALLLVAVLVGLALCLANNCVAAAQALFAEAYDDIADLAQSVRQLSSATTRGGIPYYIEPNKQKQSVRRGWTDQDIEDMLDNPADTAPAVDRTSGPPEPATNYYRKDGHYVVRNNRTGKIVQTSDRNATDDKPWIDETTNQPIHPR